MTEQRAVTDIVFDMGNVLMTFDGHAFAEAYADTPEDAELIYGALFGRTEWALLDSGTIDHETIARVAEAHVPERLLPNLRACIAGWPELSEPIAATNALACRLKKQGYGIYVLSNASTRIGEQLGHMPAMSVVDGWVASAFERIMKPDPTIFRALCERYDLVPSQCLFVDDSLDNCVGAEVAGMRSFHFTGNVDELEAAIAEAH